MQKVHATFEGAPYINPQSLSEKGFIAKKFKNWKQQWHLLLKSDLFSMYILLGEECLQRLGLQPEQYNNFEWSLLEALGFTDEQIEEANDLYLRNDDC